MLKQIVTAAVACVGFAALASAPALAAPGDARPRIAIPDDEGGGGDLMGCYRLTERIYGPYRVSFCLEQRGTYKVTGGNLNCEGKLNWEADGRDVFIDLQRSRCGNGVAWTADSLECKVQGMPAGKQRIAVPDGKPSLRCKYIPSERYKPTNVTARPID